MSEGKFFWNGEEVSERIYRQNKFCLCGGLNEDGKTTCKRCTEATAAVVKRIEDARKPNDHTTH